MVEDPNYIVEYYFPFSYLLDENLEEVIISEPVGFDVAVIPYQQLPAHLRESGDSVLDDWNSKA